MILLHGVVACDGESAAFDNNFLHFQCVRVCVQCRALDKSHAQGNGRVFGQWGRNVQVFVEGLAGRTAVEQRTTKGEQCGTAEQWQER